MLYLARFSLASLIAVYTQVGFSCTDSTPCADPQCKTKKLYKDDSSSAVRLWLFSTEFAVKNSIKTTNVIPVKKERMGIRNKGVFEVMGFGSIKHHGYIVKITDGCDEFERLTKLKKGLTSFQMSNVEDDGKIPSKLLSGVRFHSLSLKEGKSSETPAFGSETPIKSIKFSNIVEYGMPSTEGRLCFGLLEKAEGMPISEFKKEDHIGSVFGLALGQLHTLYKLSHGDPHENNIFFDNDSKTVTFIDNAEINSRSSELDMLNSTSSDSDDFYRTSLYNDLHIAILKRLNLEGFMPFQFYYHYLFEKAYQISDETWDGVVAKTGNNIKFIGRYSDASEEDVRILQTAIKHERTRKMSQTMDHFLLGSVNLMKYYYSFMQAYLSNYPEKSTLNVKIRKIFMEFCKRYASNGLGRSFGEIFNLEEETALSKEILLDLKSLSPELIACISGIF